MQEKMTAYCWTEWRKITRNKRIYTLPLYRYEATGLFWQLDKPMMTQFTMVMDQGTLRIADAAGVRFLIVPLSRVPGGTTCPSDKSDFLRISTGKREKFKIGDGWKAEVEFCDLAERGQCSARKWSEFPGKVKFRLVVV